MGGDERLCVTVFRRTWVEAIFHLYPYNIAAFMV